MYFTEEEKRAIVKVANGMIAADGDANPREILLGLAVFQKLGITKEQIDASEELNPVSAFNVILKMNYENKKIVAALLGTIMAIDGDIDDNEQRFWSFVSECGQLPMMNIGEALDIIKNL